MNKPPPPAREPGTRAALLLARSAASLGATVEMETLAQQLRSTGLVARVAFAFAENGTPSLREALRALADKGVDEVLLLPLLLPVEPGFRLWLGRAVQRWRAAAPDLRWPQVRLAPGPADAAAMKQVLREMLGEAEQATPLGESALLAFEASLVPAQHWRVLVCRGVACNNAGAGAAWGHLVTLQERLDLRTRGRGMLACTTSCLGPCSLAPVLQVWPEGQVYGGVDEAGVGRIVQEHLLEGRVVADLAFAPNGRKQRLRKHAAPRPAPLTTASTQEAPP